MKIPKFLQSSILLAVLINTPAWSADALPRGSSVFETFRTQGSVIFDSRFFGPSVASFSAYRPDLNTGTDNLATPIKTENKLTLSYRLPSGLTLFGSAEGIFYPAATFGVQAKDPSVGIRRNGLFQSGGYTLDAGARFYAGLSSASRSAGQWGALRLDQTSRLHVGGSRLDLVLFNWLQANGLSPTTATSRDLGYFLSPSAEYRLGSNVKAILGYKLWASHLVGKPIFETGTDLALVGPGINWDVTSNLSLNPYLDFAIANKPGWDTTTLGMYLWWKMI